MNQIFINKIISLRNFRKFVFYEIVYEWEDIISKCTDLPIITKNKYVHCLNIAKNIIETRIPLRIRSIFPHQKYGLRFVMIAERLIIRSCGVFEIPVVIDYFLDKQKSHQFINSIKNLPLVLITSREAWQYLIQEGASPEKVRHWALSLPDQYAFKKKYLRNKRYDMALIGRTSERFKEYLKRYLEEFPETTIVSRKIESGHFNFYDNNGEFVGDADTREGYMDIMRNAKSMIYTTPGLDGEKMTNGFSQVTPRFLEALACGCMPVLSYRDNPDTDYYELKSFGKNVESYDDFRSELRRILTTPVDAEKLERYLSNHYTSKRTEELKKILSEYK